MDAIIDYLGSIRSLDDLGLPFAILATLGWFWGIVSMVRRVIHARNLPPEERPVHTQKFYLLQAWVAFGWIFPMFLVFEIMELYFMD